MSHRQEFWICGIEIRRTFASIVIRQPDTFNQYTSPCRNNISTQAHTHYPIIRTRCIHSYTEIPFRLKSERRMIYIHIDGNDVSAQTPIFRIHPCHTYPYIYNTTQVRMHAPYQPIARFNESFFSPITLISDYSLIRVYSILFSNRVVATPT